MSTPTPTEIREMLGDLLEQVLTIRDDYEAAYKMAYGRRGGMSDRISGTASELTSVEARAEKSRPKGKCRRAGHLIREAIDKLGEAERALGAVLGAEEALTTDAAVGRRTVSEREYAESRHRQRERRRGGDARWGDA